MEKKESANFAIYSNIRYSILLLTLKYKTMVKKLLLLFALALTAATWTTMDARWVIGERKNASQIHAGDTVVLQFAAKESQSDRYLQVADESYTDRDLIIGKGLGIGSAAIITFEEGPNDIRTDAPTLYIKFVENDMYIATLPFFPLVKAVYDIEKITPGEAVLTVQGTV